MTFRSGAFALLFALGVCAVALPARAQVASILPSCASQTLTTGNSQITMDQTGALCVNATVTATATTTATASATPTPVIAGTGKPLNIDLFSELFVQPAFGGQAASTGTGAVGTGSQRVAVGVDIGTIAGSSPGVAGTPSANVISVQGISGGTTLPVQLNQGGSVVSATNGTYSNLLQGNAVLSTANPLPMQPSNAYPVGATAITASATGTTAATTATLAGTAAKTTYICSYSVRANATGAATVTDTVTGVITATMSSILWVAPLASGLGVDEQIFTPCVPASGTNQAIAVVSGTPGSGGTVSVHATGYQQ